MSYPDMPNWPMCICAICKREAKASHATWSLSGIEFTLHGFGAPTNWYSFDLDYGPFYVCPDCRDATKKLRP